PFTGKIDEVRVYKVALSAAAVAADMGVPADDRQTHITSVTPSAAGIGQSVTLAGINFGVIQDTTTVTFNGTTASASSWSPTSVVVAVPAGATSGPIVMTKQGVGSNAVSFTVVPAPVITSITPNNG